MNPDASRAIDDEPCHCGSGIEHHTDMHRVAPEYPAVTTYAHTAAAIDRFLSRWDLGDEDVLAVTIYASDVTIQLRHPLANLEWTAEPWGRGIFYRHHTTHEDVDIKVHVFTPNKEDAA